MKLILIFLYGIVIGSFLNVCIYRIPKGMSIVLPSSYCIKCNKKIKFYDLIPILSWIFLKGKCRYCKNKISLRYILIEFLTGVIFLLIFLKYGLSLEGIKFAIVTSYLIVIGFIDYDTYNVYSITTWSGILIGFMYILIYKFIGIEIKGFLVAATLSGIITMLIVIVTKGMGWGDVEICILAGIFLGIKNTMFMLFISFLLGGIVGLYLILFKNKSKKDSIPFGPFISIASIFSILFSDTILSIYMGLF